MSYTECSRFVTAALVVACLNCWPAIVYRVRYTILGVRMRLLAVASYFGPEGTGSLSTDEIHKRFRHSEDTRLGVPSLIRHAAAVLA